MLIIQQSGHDNDIIHHTVIAQQSRHNNDIIQHALVTQQQIHDTHTKIEIEQLNIQHSGGAHIGDVHANINGTFQQIPIGMPMTPILQKPRFNAPKLNIPTLNSIPILQMPHANPIPVKLHIPIAAAH